MLVNLQYDESLYFKGLILDVSDMKSLICHVQNLSRTEHFLKWNDKICLHK